MRRALSIVRWISAVIAVTTLPVILLFGMQPDDPLLRALATTNGDFPEAIRKAGGVVGRGSTGEIVSVDLAAQPWTAAGLKRLTELTHLRSLSLGSGTVTPAEAALFQKFTHLRQLQLKYSRIEENAFAELDTLADLEAVRFLDTQVSATDLKHLARLPKLRLLELRRSPGVIPELPSILATMTQLESLSLQENPLDDETFAALGGLPRLQRLDLRQTLAGDEQVRHLAPLVELRDLMLDRNPVTDAGLTHLKGMSRLEMLSLTRCRLVTGQSLEFLDDLPSLKRLNVRRTSVTPAELEAFARRVPSCLTSQGMIEARF